MPEEPSDKPSPNAELKPVGYMLGLMFHPPIKLDRKKGFEFAAQLSDFIDPQNAQINDQGWFFGQQVGEAVTGGLQIAVNPQQIQFNFSQISYALEWMEQRCSVILEAFESQFKPQLVLNAASTYEGVLQIDGDARRFLSKNLMHVNMGHLDEFKRPLQLVGVRFVMPPFRYADAPNIKSKKPKASNKGNDVDWGVEVRAESLLEDSSKLFIHATANWTKPSPWIPDSTIKTAVGYLETVTKYVKNDVLKFLSKATEQEEPPQ